MLWLTVALLMLTVLLVVDVVVRWIELLTSERPVKDRAAHVQKVGHVCYLLFNDRSIEASLS
jgi:hypothetical protein